MTTTPLLVNSPMAEATRARLTRMLVTLAELYGENPSPERITAYVEALADVPFEELRRAVQSHIRNSSWFPKPADLRSAVDRDRTAEAAIVPADVVCTRCEDSGWVIVKERTDYAQPTAQRCACYRTNPKLVSRSPLVVKDARADRENWR